MAEEVRPIELIRLAVGGDEVALQRLLMSAYDRLGRRVARRLPASVRGPLSEEDILQLTFAKVFEKIREHEPRGPGQFYRWLCKIADRQLQDAVRAAGTAKRGGDHRRVQHLPGHVDSTHQQIIDLLAGPRRTPSQFVARREAVKAVRRAMSSLSDDHRRALQLRYVQAMPVAAVAQAMGRTNAAVHNLCHRGLRELHVLLGASSKYLTRT